MRSLRRSFKGVNFRKRSQHITLTVLVLVLTVSIVLAVPEKNTSSTQLILSSKTANTNGELLWNKTFGEIGQDEGYCVLETSDGGYVLTGFKHIGDNGNKDVWLIKTNTDGEEVWNKTYGGSTHEYGYSVAQTTDGGYIITGLYHTETVILGDVLLIKTYANGTQEWTNTFSGQSTFDMAYCVIQASDEGYVIVGQTGALGGNGNINLWLIKANSTGDLEWNQTFGGAYNDVGYSVIQVSDGGYVIVGATWSFGAGWSDVWLIKDSRFKNLEDTRDNDGESILSNNNVAIFIAIGVSITISALFGKYLSRKIKHRQEKPKEKGEWEGVFFKYK